ncbi:MAG: DUF3078 domain-containing protein [Ekhidna sp.]|nr:DUF3078 domain-containing protein [Ekhidna sp.]MBC6424965.1 DUF3078 domain-containing protein [Ekhidna sp.]
MIKNIGVFLLLVLTNKLVAQQNVTASDTSYWRIGGTSSLTFSQVSLTNWAGGGDNTVSINSNFSMFADRVKKRGKWENYIDLGYGLIKQGDFEFEKSDDRIVFGTRYSYRIENANDKWFYTGLLDFKTQFAPGFDVPSGTEGRQSISDFLAPGYLTIGTGIDYSPNEFLSLSYIPISGKFTFVTIQRLANEGAFGVDPAVVDEVTGEILEKGKNSRAELGSFFRAQYKKENFESRLELFTNYMEDFGTIDVNWQNAWVVQLTKFISANFFTQLIYDKDILIGKDNNGDGDFDDPGELDDRVQFKSVIGVGLGYNFGARKSE